MDEERQRCLWLADIERPRFLKAYTVVGNVQGNIILFEPSTSEHISARTIFDPITALAPAYDCRSYAVGYVPRLGMALIPALTLFQVHERLHPDCSPSTLLHHTAHFDNSTCTVADSVLGLACFVIEAEVKHVSYTVFRWRSSGLECCQTSYCRYP